MGLTVKSKGINESCQLADAELPDEFQKVAEEDCLMNELREMNVIEEANVGCLGHGSNSTPQSEEQSTVHF